MVFIKYVFLVFTKKDGKLCPMNFNVKELTSLHLPILKKVERLIKHELPYRFGILTVNEYNNNKDNENNPFDDEYKLFYSRYRYGKFFHISTEYIHTMLNISDKEHGYKNSITLEELNYSCGLNSDYRNPFFQDIQIDYQVREHQINNYIIFYYQILKIKKHLETSKKLNLGSRSTEVFKLYEQSKIELHPFKISLENKSLFNTLNNDVMKKIKFILMYKTNIQQYTFIYLLDKEFYKLVIISNMEQILDDIIKQLIPENEKLNSIQFNEPNKLFKIISNNKLDEEYWKEIFEISPIIIKMFTKPIILDNKKINTYYYYSTDLLDIKKLKNYNDITMINLYDNTVHIPLVLQNYLKTYGHKYNKKNIMYNKNSTHFADCVKIKDCTNITNYLHLNQNNCGYDFIESIDDKQGKITIYIYPSKNTTTQTKYLGNYMDLDKSSIPMLKSLILLYLYNDDYVIFLHKTITIWFYCLHFHIIKKSQYKRETFYYT